jgi:very-short-patch-repair endonuclease
VPVHRTRSELEHWFLGICDTYDLPHPHVNQDEDGKERDFRWPGLATLVVEVDGSQHRWADDRRRDRELFVRTGLTTIRFTGDEPAAEVAKTVSEALHRLRMVG